MIAERSNEEYNTIREDVRVRFATHTYIAHTDISTVGQNMREESRRDGNNATPD